jgi:excisionase family DNA binding protein
VLRALTPEDKDRHRATKSMICGRGDQIVDQTRIAFSVLEAAKCAGVGRTTLFEEIRSGRLAARKVGRRTIIMTADLEAWLKSLPTRASFQRMRDV